jgi:hypothetical protein
MSLEENKSRLAENYRTFHGVQQQATPNRRVVVVFFVFPAGQTLYRQFVKIKL